MDHFMAKEMSGILDELSTQTENLFLEQLNELVKRGAIVCEKGPMMISQNAAWGGRDTKFTIQQQVRFVLKDQEYIEKLEQQVKELREIIARIKAVPGV